MSVHLIHDRWIGGAGEHLVSTDPASGGIVWHGREATVDEVDGAVAGARGAFEAWRDTALERRIELIRSFAGQVERNRDDLAELISRETGKPHWESLGEVDAMIGKAAISIEAHWHRCAERRESAAGATGVMRFRPHGVCAVFGPFNFPGHLPNGHIIPALLAGNTIVFKPSEQAPAVAQRTVELWQSAALPAGVVNLVQGGRPAGEALASHAGIDGLFFTGSAAVGLSLRRALAEHPEKILALEMGGNNPLIVHDVGDPAAAAVMIVQSAYLTSGQRCSCARRLILTDRSRAEGLLAKLVDLIGRIRVGPHTDRPEPFMGPVICERVADELLAAQRRLLNLGGRALVEMRRLPAGPAMLSPGLIDMTEAADRPDEEYFGPLLQVIRVGTLDEALAEANNTRFGLAAGLLSDDRSDYERFFHRIRAGVVNWNRPLTGASSRLAFGGVKQSGNHRPSAYLAADYCAYPVASLEVDAVKMPVKLPPGLDGA